MTPDPIGQFGGLNLFIYVKNNPVNEVDPEGLMGRKPELPKIPDNREGWLRLIKRLNKYGNIAKKCKDINDTCQPNWDIKCSECCTALAKSAAVLTHGDWHIWWNGCYTWLCLE